MTTDSRCSEANENGRESYPSVLCILHHTQTQEVVNLMLYVFLATLLFIH